MPEQFIVGIDPGIFGAIAIIRPGPVISELSALPAKAEELATVLRLIDEPRGAIGRVAVELQTAMPRQGRTSIASQMRGYGHIIGVCAGLGLPLQTIAPVVWRRRTKLETREKASLLHAAWLRERGSDPGWIPTERPFDLEKASAIRAATLQDAGWRDWKRESLAHARTVPNFTSCEPKRCNNALLVGMADAVLIALAVANADPSFKAYHWRF